MVAHMDEANGFATPALYHRAQYMGRPPFRPFHRNTSEEGVFFDMESKPTYQHVYPRTLTVEGFGLEAWRYAKEHSGPQYSHKTLALRLKFHPNASLTDMSPKILASLIVQDLYFRNAKISLQNKPIQPKKVDNPDEIRAAED
ncbi:hypothetical protein ACJ73_00361 [Blastomyces percursus]|uniref:Uncharacterized protein n=1 Tax=Blastomyces percursus TaxID=1658174 RepID=A0A1J9RI56_9EURO|nr:hypothetical protein ACJ73_00361 [Blastomyces percursus]